MAIEHETKLAEATNSQTTYRGEPPDICVELALENSILSVLDRSLKDHGFTGPTHIPRLVFLSFYTRILEKPVSLIIKGPSGSGKSFSLRAGKQYIPSSAFEEFHGMSERALLYMKELNLKHRYLIIQEAAGLSTGIGRVFLRQLLSEGQINYATVQNTDEGLVGKRLPVLEGPMGAMMTTTANELHLEDETRFISVHIDDSPERVREALLSQAKGARTEANREDLAHWHALHDYVCSGSTDVDIPYAESLAKGMPLSHPRVQRDFPQLLSLIKAHALLHQLSRDCPNNRVVANLDDYREVYNLIAGPLAEGLEASVPRHIKAMVEAVQSLAEQCKIDHAMPDDAAVYVSQRAVADHLGVHPSSVSRAAIQAIEQGYLENEAPGQGRESKLKLGSRRLPAGYVLPTPDDLAATIATSSQVTRSPPIVIPGKKH